LNCIWEINVNKDSRIILIFNDIRVENNYDFIEVFDGNSVLNQTIGNITGSNKTATLISSSNSLIVSFKTDHSVIREGFSAYYKIKRNGQFIIVLFTSELFICLNANFTFSGKFFIKLFIAFTLYVKFLIIYLLFKNCQIMYYFFISIFI
jgi:hypothetical protein